MKLVIGWLAAITVALVIAGSCSINHRSNDYECSTQADCEQFPGRTCSDGFCISTSGPPVDARPDGTVNDGRPDTMSPDSATCPSECSSCNQTTHTCTIDCSVTSCNGDLVCPAGWNCNIGCNTANSCRSSIDCTDAKSCTITCSGTSSCRNLVAGEGQVKVTCSGAQSCRNMDCSDSCACDVSCSIGSSCEATQCPDGCSIGAGRCSSQLPQCNSCQ